MIDWLTDWLNEWMTDRMNEWQTNRLTDWLTDRHTDCQTDRLIKSLTEWVMMNQMSYWLMHCLRVLCTNREVYLINLWINNLVIDWLNVWLMSVQPSGISWWLIGKLIYKLIYNQIVLAAQNIHVLFGCFVMLKNCNHTWRHEKQATSIVCGPVSMPAFHVFCDLVHLKKRLYLYGTLHVWEIAGKCSQTSLPKCVKTNLFLQAKHNMVTSKVVLCDQFKGEIDFQHFGWMAGLIVH